MRKFFASLVMIMLIVEPLSAGTQSAPRLIPKGSVTLLESGIVVDKEIPAPAGMLMACTGQCFIEASGLQLVGADKTVFALHEENTRFSVMVLEGNVDFSLHSGAKPLVFKTPFHDPEGAKPYLIPASSDEVFRGSLQVTTERAILTMTKGSLKLVSTDGQKLIHAGNAIILAQYSPPKDKISAFATNADASTAGDDWTGIAVGAATVGILGATIAALAGGGGGGGGGGGDGDTKEVTPH